MATKEKNQDVAVVQSKSESQFNLNTDMSLKRDVHKQMPAITFRLLLLNVVLQVTESWNLLSFS